MWARLPIAVDGRPLTDIEVPLQVGGRLSGRVVFEGTGAPPEGDELTTIAVRVQSADGDVTRLPIVRLDGSGRFTSPGRFTAGDGEPARGHHVHDADDCRTLQTTRSDEQGRFSFTGFTPDRALWTRFSRRIQSARPSGDGRYTFRYLPPGDRHA